MTTTTADRGLRLFGRELKPEGVYALVGLAVVWQIVSLFMPDYLFPSVPQIAARFVEIFSSWQTAYDAVATGAAHPRRARRRLRVRQRARDR